MAHQPSGLSPSAKEKKDARELLRPAKSLVLSSTHVAGRANQTRPLMRQSITSMLLKHCSVILTNARLSLVSTEYYMYPSSGLPCLHRHHRRHCHVLISHGASRTIVSPTSCVTNEAHRLPVSQATGYTWSEIALTPDFCHARFSTMDIPFHKLAFSPSFLTHVAFPVGRRLSTQVCKQLPSCFKRGVVRPASGSHGHVHVMRKSPQHANLAHLQKSPHATFSSREMNNQVSTSGSSSSSSSILMTALSEHPLPALSISALFRPNLPPYLGCQWSHQFY